MTLSFNMSVKDRKAVINNNDAFQVMPATRNFITDNIINTYPQGHNPKILIHMNYVTKPFMERAFENGSRERFSLRQYGKLADKLGTKNILIHLPESITEWNNTFLGLSIINEELHDYIIHLEIPSFSREFINHLKLRLDNALDVLVQYLDVVIKYINEKCQFKFKIVFDTAHLHANGLIVDDMIELMNKYKEHIEYIHLNGNINYMLTPDSHVPIFSNKNKIRDVEKLSEYISSLNKICIAEVTKLGATFDEWREYATKYNFALSTNDMYSH